MNIINICDYTYIPDISALPVEEAEIDFEALGWDLDDLGGYAS